MKYLKRKDDAGHGVPIQSGRLNIGRDASNDVVIEDEMASGFHATLFNDEGSLFLVDVGSSNGTLVNGKHVSGRPTLELWSTIQIGETIYEIFDPGVKRVKGTTIRPAISDGSATVVRPSLSAQSDVVATLFLIKGSNAPAVFKITGDVKVGRNERNGLRIAHDMVSGNHATMQVREGVVMIEDLGSSNGTFVNGTRVNKMELDHGDTLRFDEIEYRVEYAGRQEKATRINAAVHEEPSKTVVRSAIPPIVKEPQIEATIPQIEPEPPSPVTTTPVVSNPPKQVAEPPSAAKTRVGPSSEVQRPQVKVNISQMAAEPDEDQIREQSATWKVGIGESFGLAMENYRHMVPGIIATILPLPIQVMLFAQNAGKRDIFGHGYALVGDEQTRVALGIVSQILVLLAGALLLSGASRICGIHQEPVFTRALRRVFPQIGWSLLLYLMVALPAIIGGILLIVLLPNSGSVYHAGSEPISVYIIITVITVFVSFIMYRLMPMVAYPVLYPGEPVIRGAWELTRSSRYFVNLVLPMIAIVVVVGGANMLLIMQNPVLGLIANFAAAILLSPALVIFMVGRIEWLRNMA